MNDRHLQELLAVAANGAKNKPSRTGINTFGEKSAHTVLKYYFEPDESRHEIPHGGFVADILSGGNIIEIQTRAFARLREKLTVFLRDYNVMIVHPNPVVMSKITVDKKTGESFNSYSRKKAIEKDITQMSFKERFRYFKGFFKEMFGLADFWGSGNLSFCAVLAGVEEIRFSEKERIKIGRRRRMTDKCDTLIKKVLEEVYFREAADWLFFAELHNMKEPFTSKDYAEHINMRIETAQLILNLYTKMKLVSRIGKKGNSFLYSATVS